MNLTGKHIVKEINGTRCSLIENDISIERVNFLKNILEYNGYEVKFAAVNTPALKATNEITEKSEMTAELFILGVTDVTFSLSVVLYGRALKNPESGEVVSVSYWESGLERGEVYWEF